MPITSRTRGYALFACLSLLIVAGCSDDDGPRPATPTAIPTTTATGTASATRTAPATATATLPASATTTPSATATPVASDTPSATATATPSATVPPASVYSFANGCWAIESSAGVLARDGDGFAFTAAAFDGATPFFLKASRLGSYLLYDDAGGYLVSDGAALQRETSLASDITTVDDTFQSEAEWDLLPGPDARYLLRHRKSGTYLATAGVSAEAAPIALRPRGGCARFPEEETWASGAVSKTEFPDGAVYGFSDAHSHILANFGFGGGGIYHGAPFHPLGIEHALGSCERFHGPEGRADLFGAGYDAGNDIALEDFVGALVTGELPNFNHFTAGYPDFTTWPSAHDSSTHQVQYYKWLERAYLGGLRLVVQHAVNNQIICDLLGNGGIQPIRYPCNDMVAIDRQLVEVRHMQDYVDAQAGGPGQGWFRVVTSPAEARTVIRAGKMAVVLGIETSNLFDCFLTPSEAFPACTEADVQAKLDHYHDLGVRVMFPVHKYDNAFSAGDGNKGFIELGNIITTGHFSNFTTDCDPDTPTVFDRGPMTFPGMNEPRADYFAPAPNDFSQFYIDPIATFAPFLERLAQAPIPGENNHCQQAGLTPLGEFLITRMLAKGMIVELDHLPRHSYKRAFEILQANDYPGAGTHGIDNAGRLYALGGISTSGFSTCRSATTPATVDDGFQGRLQRIRANGGYPGLGFGLDLNGFAGAPGPRFGAKSGCGTQQSDPVTYPFTSFAGDVTFDQPKVGHRTLDFNTEGLAHIGLLPELIQDVRGDGVGDADLEPLFRSAEAYLRMWEKAERRAAEMAGRGPILP